MNNQKIGIISTKDGIGLDGEIAAWIAANPDYQIYTASTCMVVTKSITADGITTAQEILFTTTIVAHKI